MLVGVIGILLAALLYAVYFKLYERLGKIVNTKTIIFYQFLIVALMVTFLWGGIEVDKLTNLSLTSWLYLMILVFFCTLGGYGFAILSIKRVGALITGTVDFLEPIIGVSLAMIILGESMTWIQLIGWFMIIFTLVNIKKIK